MQFSKDLLPLPSLKGGPWCRSGTGRTWVGSDSSTHRMRSLANCSVLSLFIGKIGGIKSIRSNCYESKHNRRHSRQLYQFGFDEESRTTMSDIEYLYGVTEILIQEFGHQNYGESWRSENLEGDRWRSRDHNVVRRWGPQCDVGKEVYVRVCMWCRPEVTTAQQQRQLGRNAGWTWSRREWG